MELIKKKFLGRFLQMKTRRKGESTSYFLKFNIVMYQGSSYLAPISIRHRYEASIVIYKY